MKVRTSTFAALALVSLAACDTPVDPTSQLIPGAPARSTTARATLTIVDPDSMMQVKSTQQLQSIAQSGTEVSRNNPSVTWVSTDTTVARVSSRGLVTAVASGVSLIVATHVWRGGPNRDTLKLHVVDTASKVTATAVTSTPATPAVPDAPAAPVTPSAGATPPAMLIATSMPSSSRSLLVKAGGNLQAAIDSARPGDAILLEGGATYRGAFVLRNKQSAQGAWIVIRPADMSTLPGEGSRVSPANAVAMPKLVMPSGNQGAISTDPGAGYYRLVGVEITTDAAVKDLNALVRLYTATPKAATDFPHHIVLDRVYAHGTSTLQLTRCVLGNGASIAVVDSYLSECHAKGRDSQAFESWDGAGPYKLVNNYLEGAGENVMFGGAPSTAAEFNPADIEIRGNHFFKPLAWLPSKQWTVKNLLELKNAQRVLVEGNVFENNWVDAQTGRAILIRAADQTANVPWSRTKDITIRYNIVRHSPSGFSIDAQGPYEGTSRVVVENNLIYDIGDHTLGSGGVLFQLTGSVAGVALKDITIRHNTGLFSTGTAVRLEAIILDGGPHQNATITSNVFELGSYGIKGSGATSGNASLAKYLTNSVVSDNVLIGSSSAAYASGDKVTAAGTVNFLNAAAGDLRMTGLFQTSAAGADVATVLAKTANAVR